jgi:hypothetical protein
VRRIHPARRRVEMRSPLPQKFDSARFLRCEEVSLPRLLAFTKGSARDHTMMRALLQGSDMSLRSAFRSTRRDGSGRGTNHWMRHMAAHFTQMRRAYPGEELCVASTATGRSWTCVVCSLADA